MKTIDIRTGCCTFNKKLLLKELRQIFFGQKIEFIAENTESTKRTIEKFVQKEGCRIIKIEDLPACANMQI